MNLDELQSVQARERQSSDLQHLRSSFYQEVGTYIQELTEERAEAVERSEEPFSAPEVRQLSDDIETAEQTVEAIYERRVGKVVKKASIAAAGMPVDDDGLTAEEEALFEDLVDRIEENRATVLSVLDGSSVSVSASNDSGTTRADDGSATADGPDGTATDDAPASPDRDGQDHEDGSADSADPGAVDAADPGAVDAADLMGGGTDDGSTGASEDGTTEAPEDGSTDGNASGSGPREVSPEPAPPGDPGSEGSSGGGSRSEQPSGADGTERSDDESGGSVPGLPRTTVRITADVGEVVGADNRDYDLSEEDVVTLPEPNAEVLLEKDAAERLE